MGMSHTHNTPLLSKLCSGIAAGRGPFSLVPRLGGRQILKLAHWPHTLKLPSTLRSVAWEAPHCFSLVLTTNR